MKFPMKNLNLEIDLHYIDDAEEKAVLLSY